MGMKQTFVQNLKKFRKLERISQMKLAEQCATDVSYIGQIEMGIRFPSMELIEKIAKALEVEPYRFFMDDPGEKYGDLDGVTTFLNRMPHQIRLDLIDRLSTAIKDCMELTLAP
jgi:transcriptional regulator with XRE-family HTH domain